MNNITETSFSIGRWTKATFWGWLLGVALILALSSLLDSIGIEHMQFYLGVGMGAGVGFMQWRLLKKFIPIDKMWIWIGVAGMGIPFVIFDLMPAEIISHKIAWSICLGALDVGLLQYFLVLKKHSPKAHWWIPGAFAGWVLGVGTVFLIDYTNQLKPLGATNLVLALLNLTLILGGGVVLGVVSGAAMKKVL